MVGVLHRRLRQIVMRPDVHLVPGWLLHAGQAGSLTKPPSSMPKCCMQSMAWMPAVPYNAQLPVPSQERPALSLQFCLQVQQHCQRFGMQATPTDPALLRALIDVESCPPAPVQQGNTIVGQVGLKAASPELQWLDVLQPGHQRLALRSPRLHLDPAVDPPTNSVSVHACQPGSVHMLLSPASAGAAWAVPRP